MPTAEGDVGRRQCYQLYRERMQHEDSLIGTRISWLMASQSFLLSPFVLLNNDPRFFSLPDADQGVRAAQQGAFQQLTRESHETTMATRRVQQDCARLSRLSAMRPASATPEEAALQNSLQAARQDAVVLQGAQQAEALARAGALPPPSGVEPLFTAFVISLLVAVIGALTSLASFRSVQAAIRSMSCLCLEFIGKFPQDSSYEPGISVARNQGVHGLVTARRMPPLFFGVWMILIGLTLGMHVGAWMSWTGGNFAVCVGAFVLLLGLISLVGYARYVWADKVEEQHTNEAIATVQQLRRQLRRAAPCPEIDIWPYPEDVQAEEMAHLLSLYAGSPPGAIRLIPKEGETACEHPALNAGDFKELHHEVFLAAHVPPPSKVKRYRTRLKLFLLGQQVKPFQPRLDFMVTDAGPEGAVAQVRLWPLATNHVLVVRYAAPRGAGAAAPDDGQPAAPDRAEEADSAVFDDETLIQGTVGVDMPSE